MSLPNLPVFYDMPITEHGDRISSEGYIYNDNLWQTLDLAVKLLNSIVTTELTSASPYNSNTLINNGIVFPSKTNAEITSLEPDASLGTVWFSTTDAKLKLKTAAGTIETITSA